MLAHECEQTRPDGRRRRDVQAMSWIAEECGQTPVRLHGAWVTTRGCVTRAVLTGGCASAWEDLVWNRWIFSFPRNAGDSKAHAWNPDDSNPPRLAAILEHGYRHYITWWNSRGVHLRGLAPLKNWLMTSWYKTFFLSSPHPEQKVRSGNTTVAVRGGW